MNSDVQFVVLPIGFFIFDFKGDIFGILYACWDSAYLSLLGGGILGCLYGVVRFAPRFVLDLKFQKLGLLVRVSC